MLTDPQGSQSGDKLSTTQAGGDPTELAGVIGTPESPTNVDGQTPMFDDGTFSPPSTGYQPYWQDVS